MKQSRIRVWDLPTRLFHWALFLLVTGAIVSVKIGGNAMVWHGRFGHLIFGLIVFRLIWGFVGSTHSRFGDFVRGPRAILDYLQGRWHGLGHNPLGALSVLALLGLIGFQATSGLFSNDDIAFNGPLVKAVSSDTSNWISSWHRRTEWVIYGLIALHLAAVLFYTVFKREPLVSAMITGNKPVDRAASGSDHSMAESTTRTSRGGGWLALVFALGVTVFALWASSGAWLPPPPPPPPDLGW